MTSPPPTLLPLALQSVSNSTLILPQSSEKQEQQKKEEAKAEAAWQGKGEDISQLEVNVEGDVLLGLSITQHHLAVHLLILLLILKSQFGPCDHPRASDGHEVKLCVGGGEVDAGQGGGRGGCHQVPLATCILRPKQEDCWKGGSEVPRDGAGGEGEGGEKEGRFGRGRIACGLTTCSAEKGKRAEGGGEGGAGENERAHLSALHCFSRLVILLCLATGLAPCCLDLSAEQGLQRGEGGHDGQGKGGDGNDEGEHELLHLPLSQVDCGIEAGNSKPYSRWKLTGGDKRKKLIKK